MGCLGFLLSFGEIDLEAKALTIGATSLWGAVCMFLCWGLSYLLLPRRVCAVCYAKSGSNITSITGNGPKAGLLNENANSHVRLQWNELTAWACGHDYLLFYISEAKVLFVGKRAMTEEQSRV